MGLSDAHNDIVAALKAYDTEETIGCVVMTGAGERAFSADQDFAEAHDFDAERAESWIREWGSFYDQMRRMTKPVVMALNGTAAGSAFQVALLGDIRVGHDQVTMGATRYKFRHREYYRPMDHEGNLGHVADR